MLIPPELLGMFLRDRRKALGLSQRQVAERSGIDDSRISRFETGQQLPTLIELPSLAAALDVDAAAFLQALGVISRPIDLTRLSADLARALRELDDHGLEVLAYTARGLLLQQSEAPEPSSDAGRMS